MTETWSRSVLQPQHHGKA